MEIKSVEELHSLIKEYISENLTISIEMEKSEEFDNVTKIRTQVSIMLDDEVIATDSDYYTMKSID